MFLWFFIIPKMADVVILQHKDFFQNRITEPELFLEQTQGPKANKAFYDGS